MYGVLEVLRLGHGRNQRTLGQAAMADFAALWLAETACFARSERREVVVQHETITVLAHDGINDLLVLLGTQGSHDQCLSFATREQGTAVCTGKHAQADADGAHGARVAKIDTRLDRKSTRLNSSH